MDMKTSLQRLAMLLVPVWLACQTPRLTAAALYIDMGPAPLLGAYDQPFVRVTLQDGQTALGPSSTSNMFLMDTGSTSVLVVGEAAADLRRSGGDFAQGEYLEQGIGGFTLYDVSAPYTLRVTGMGGSVERERVRILSDPSQSFGEAAGFDGLVGMPALVERVTTLDMVSGGPFGDLSGVDLSDLDQLIDAVSGSISGMGVSFSETLPAGNGHRYGVPIRALHFEPPPDQGLPPTMAPLPMVTATHRLEGRSITGGNYILDTGAQMSFISLEKARALGLDPEDPFFFQPISGVGGVTNAPVFYIDELSLMTEEGIELVWREAQVIGLDLDPSIDGVVGADILTAGMVEIDMEAIDLDNLIRIGEGPLRQAHFDFRDLERPDQAGTATMYLDPNPKYDVIQQGSVALAAGDANQDRAFDQLDIVQVLQRGRYLTGLSATWGDGDWSGGSGRPAGVPTGGRRPV